MLKKKYIIIFSLLIVSLLPLAASAEILPACTVDGNCGICDFLDTFVNIIKWVLGIVGGAALVLMIWHAWGWLTSGGNQEKIKKARDGINHTIIGVIIILGSWQIINMAIVLLVSPQGSSEIRIFGGDNSKIWYEYCNQPGEECLGRGNGSPCTYGYCQDQLCVEDMTACEYWTTNKAEYFEGYDCLPKGECDSNFNLGPDYCQGGPEEGPPTPNAPEVNCCKQRSAAP